MSNPHPVTAQPGPGLTSFLLSGERVPALSHAASTVDGYYRPKDPAPSPGTTPAVPA
jgi:hypothetical protein